MRFGSTFIRHAGHSVLILVWPFAQAIGQSMAVRLDVAGRIFSLVASALSGGPRIFQSSIIPVQGNT
jgi:hypothetical protein